MEEVIPEVRPSSSVLFNSPLETGIRALNILNAAYPRSFDLTHLIWFDHLIVHTGDFGGPVSLHPALHQRTGELLVRRRLILESLNLMQQLHFVDVVRDNSGISYRATEEASPFLALMKSSYAKNLEKRAKWLAAEICSLDSKKIEKIVSDRVGKWNVEFDQPIAMDRKVDE
jgi:hypothetical protein